MTRKQFLESLNGVKKDEELVEDYHQFMKWKFQK